MPNMGESERYRANICFDCEKALGRCSWSRAFVPVPGWTATPVERSLGTFKGNYGGKIIKTYEITACPLFERTPKK